MIYHVSARAGRGGDGTREKPFQTITEAAKIACAGDEVLVAPGVYREYVNPVNGGTGEDARIIYRSEVPLAAVITGAEVVKGWKKYQENVWLARIPNGLFGGYNPYTTVVSGDWYYAEEPVHTGEVYLNGQGQYEAVSLESVLNPVVCQESWVRILPFTSGIHGRREATQRFTQTFRARIQTRRQWKSTSAEIASIRIKPV